MLDDKRNSFISCYGLLEEKKNSFKATAVAPTRMVIPSGANEIRAKRDSTEN